VQAGEKRRNSWEMTMDAATAAQLEHAMERVNTLLAHAWMVRTFLKHADEIQENDDLLAVGRTIFDYVRALEKSYQNKDYRDYFSRAQRKLGKLRTMSDTLTVEQPRISSHTNFQMAAVSLGACVREIDEVLEKVRPLLYPTAGENQESADECGRK
jgi:hypothetical protein